MDNMAQCNLYGISGNSSETLPDLAKEAEMDPDVPFPCVIIIFVITVWALYLLNYLEERRFRREEAKAYRRARRRLDYIYIVQFHAWSAMLGCADAA